MSLMSIEEQACYNTLVANNMPIDWFEKYLTIYGYVPLYTKYNKEKIKIILDKLKNIYGDKIHFKDLTVEQQTTIRLIL